jgi:hypothetical protein
VCEIRHPDTITDWDEDSAVDVALYEEWEFEPGGAVEIGTLNDGHVVECRHEGEPDWHVLGVTEGQAIYLPTGGTLRIVPFKEADRAG